jgi:hypothetical protein
MKSLSPAIPVLPMGIFRYFWAVAYVRIGASPNEDQCNLLTHRNSCFLICQEQLLFRYTYISHYTL